MNITFLIGNGFDINLGLKTRYIDFYRYYSALSRDEDTDAIKKFKSEITRFIEDDTHKTENAIDWRDLEVALGKWTAKMKDDEVEPLYFNLIDNLRDYLTGEYRNFDTKAFDPQTFTSHLLDPVSKNFNRNRANEIRNYWNSNNGPDYLNIINFNYTLTLEQLLGFQGSVLELGVNFAGRVTRLANIYHIHQTLNDEEILVGLNDASQIENTDFHNNRHICNLLIKPDTNALLGTGINQDCERVIATTHLFVLFGTSAGITDRKWWKAICNRVRASNARLLLFVFGEKRSHMNLRHDVMSEEAIRKLLTSAGLEGESTFSAVYPNCHVCFKSGLFKLQANYNNAIPDTQTYKIGKTDVEVKVLDRGMRHLTLSVDAPSEETGVSAEAKWIKEFFPGYRETSQSIHHHKSGDVNLPYDRIVIDSENNHKELFFEISSFFGKSNRLPIHISPELRAASLVDYVKSTLIE